MSDTSTFREALERGSIEVGITIDGDVGVWRVLKDGVTEDTAFVTGDEVIPTIVAALALPTHAVTPEDES